jgi:hypothetical protein
MIFFWNTVNTWSMMCYNNTFLVFYKCFIDIFFIEIIEVWSRCANITMEFIEKHLDFPWCWNLISDNPNLTMEMIEKYPNKPRDWEWISCHPNITMEIIEKYPNKPWDWGFISKNPNITMEIIETYPNKP